MINELDMILNLGNSVPENSVFPFSTNLHAEIILCFFTDQHLLRRGCHALARWEFELYNMILRAAYVTRMRPLCYFLSPNTSASYAVSYSQHDMNASMYYYFLPISYKRDYVLYIL